MPFPKPLTITEPAAATEAVAQDAGAVDLERQQAVKNRLGTVRDLPTLPTIALEVSRLAANPLTGMSDIVRIVRNDPPLTAKILRVANSAFYGMPRRIESLNMALVVLGMRELNNLVTCITILKSFPTKKDAPFDRRSFWEHSAGAGEIARVIAARLHLRLHGVEFTAGLLHDIGKILFDQYYHDEFLRALTEAERQAESVIAVENRIIGADHAEIGAWLAERWALPVSIVEAIRYHHQPASSPDQPVLTAVVRLADVFAKAMYDNSRRRRLNDELVHEQAWDVLARHRPDIVSLDVVRFTEELEENMERAREFIRLASE
jgi:putative nucleotidyltransferase with HDIG domain